MNQAKGIIIYPSYKTKNNEAFVTFYGRLATGQSFMTKNKYVPHFYIKTKDLELAKKEELPPHEKTDMKNFNGDKLTKLNFNIPSEIPSLRDKLHKLDIDTYQADIRFPYLYMIQNQIKSTITITGNPTKENDEGVDLLFEEPQIKSDDKTYTMDDLKILSIDIETSRKKELLSVSLVSNDKTVNKVIIITNNEQLNNAQNVKTEKELLEQLKKEILQYDPDILCGWNFIDFDLAILKQKFEENNLPFNIGKSKSECKLTIQKEFLRDSKADMKGRIALDGITLLKVNFIKLDDYKLQTAAKEFTQHEKLISNGPNKVEEIYDAYINNPQKLVDYNLLDSQLVLDIFKESGAMNLTLLRSKLTGMPVDRVQASIASIDNLYLTKLNNIGYVAPTSKYTAKQSKTTGGFVMNSEPGIYQNIAVFDFKSLYPSIMRTFNIDPLMHITNSDLNSPESEIIKAPNGAIFKKQKGILSSILEELSKNRQKATDQGDKLTRGAIKILMNSIYGVMASPNCRFYSHEIANAITHFGHSIIKKTQELAKEHKYNAVYGDTDSVFLDLKEPDWKKAYEKAEKFEKIANQSFTENVKKEYAMTSYLELEFEKLYIKMFTPKTRGTERGAKKRYAGKKISKEGKTDMEFVGLEFVRSDWTDLSKKFQSEIIEKIFDDEDISMYTKNFTDKLKQGKFDELLVYRKTLRKNLEDYTKTTPPHVKAARKLDKLDGNIIKYVQTINGPEPIEKIESPYDYEHYIEKQIKPLADSALGALGLSFDEANEEQKQTSLNNF